MNLVAVYRANWCNTKIEVALLGPSREELPIKEFDDVSSAEKWADQLAQKYGCRVEKS
jgi:hypothetical protein